MTQKIQNVTLKNMNITNARICIWTEKENNVVHSSGPIQAQCIALQGKHIEEYVRLPTGWPPTPGEHQFARVRRQSRRRLLHEFATKKSSSPYRHVCDGEVKVLAKYSDAIKIFTHKAKATAYFMNLMGRIL